MQRYFIPASQFTELTVSVTGDDAHHLSRVMRAELGDRIICSNGLDREVLAEITHVGKDMVEATIVESLPMDREPKLEVWVAQSLPKGDKLETVIQKGTEVGAAKFVPFVSERTIVEFDAKKEAKKLERWRRIAKEAAEQAHRNRIPDVQPPRSWKELLKLIPSIDLALIAYEKEQGGQLRTVLNEAALAATPPHSVIVLIGPEGGFTEKEVMEAEAAGAKSVSLGKRILRTETAGLVALTCLLYDFEEMGGR